MAVDNTNKVMASAAGMVEAGWKVTRLSASGDGKGKQEWRVTWEREP